MSDALVLESLGARVRRFALPLPDALLALIFAFAASIDFFPAMAPFLFAGRENLVWILVVEGGFLLMQGTLVDIATRLKKRPPVWLIVLILGGVLLFAGNGALQVLQMAWQGGMLVFLPLLLSLAERGMMLWQMPSRTPIQKMAARALISNRIITGLALFGLMTVAVVIGFARGTPIESTDLWPTLLAGTIYYAVAAYDEARVRRQAFANNPRVLFRYDVLGVKYLEPL
jgi:hypothetical protein